MSSIFIAALQYWYQADCLFNTDPKISFRWRLGNTNLHVPGRQKGYDEFDVIDCYFIFGRLRLEEFLWRKQEGVIADGQCVYTLWQAF